MGGCRLGERNGGKEEGQMDKNKVDMRYEGEESSVASADFKGYNIVDENIVSVETGECLNVSIHSC